jgi:Tol biopolymer transport system component
LTPIRPAILLRPPRLARVLAVAGALLALAASAGAVPFGRNKVQYDTFEWRVLQTEHLEVHFYPEARELAERAAAYGEEACVRLESSLGHTLTKRIPVVVYSSHYHFRQNNVSPSLVGESTGGFTEIFRTRVVLPYAGSEEDFRHVVHHELVHAFCFDLLYGGPVKSFFVLQHAFYIPLWFMEGIAEWYSNRWDSEGEMMIRDAALEGGLPPFPRIHGGYFVYKAGWSAVDWLAERHGEDVIPRILEELGEVRDLRIAVKNVTGEDLDSLGKDWLEDVRRRTWPTLADLEGPESLGRPLTSRERTGGALNGSPTISPAGDRVVFLSDRSGTPDLWILDLGEEADDPPSPPRVLVRGARDGDFESLHPRRASAGWSPDGRWVVVAAQKGARDALFVLDSRTGRKVAEIVPDLDAMERPDWSPTNARFVFTGMRDGQVDLWAVDADGTNLTRLTDDLHEERAPRWSPDGSRIAFASDRAGSTGLDLYTIAEGEAPRPLRVAPGDQRDPAWSADGERVYFVSDERGTRDLLVLEPGGEVRRLSALRGGAEGPSLAREGGRLVMAAYSRGGWDLVLVEDADTLRTVDAPEVALGETPWAGWANARGWERPVAADSVPAAADSLAPPDGPDPAVAAADSSSPPVERDYAPRFRPEWITGQLAYAGTGLFGGIQTSIGDVLGDHRIYVATNIAGSLDRSDAYLSYGYLKRRVDLEVAIFHVRDFLYDDRTTLGQPIGEEDDESFFSERKWGAAVSATYPFHTFRRIGFELRGMELERTRYTDESRELGASLEEVSSTRSRLVIPRLYHTFDNTLWGWTGPVQGARSVVSVEHALPVGGTPVSYTTGLADYRRYRRFSRVYVVALRALGAASFGPDPQRFRVGGSYSVRGHPRRAATGRHVALLSAEFRYPFLEYVKFGWPLRTAFGGVRGDLFVDVGTAFDDPGSWRFFGPTGRPEDRYTGLEDVRLGFGFGARMRIAFLPIRVDVGWPSDLARTGKPRWHFTLGPEF